MTAKMVAVPVQYGLHELGGLCRKYASLALGIAVLLHFLAVASYYVVGFLQPVEPVYPIIRVINDPTQLGPPPSITDAGVIPPVAVSVPQSKPTLGIFVPVPDAIADPEQTIPDNKDFTPPAVESGPSGPGTIRIEPQGPLKIAEEPIYDFYAVERIPVLVRQVRPEYPDIARRLNVDGVVIVKMLIDKQGKVARATVVRSDADVLNDAAVAAALQWVFTPAMMNSGPVSVWAEVPFRFKLNR